MDFRIPKRREEQLTRQTERISAELRDGGLPLHALAATSRPAVQGQLGGLETFDGTIRSVHVVYPTYAPVGFWADVETARCSDPRRGPAGLRETLARHVHRTGHDLTSVTWEESRATLLIDGHRTTARQLRAGHRWWVLRGERSGLEITVAGRDWQPESCAVETVTDPAPVIDRLRGGSLAPGAADPPGRAPEPLPADLRGEPHRALADTVLRTADARTAWETGSGPAPDLPAYWPELWRAAVYRQMHLSGRDESTAAEAVRAMASQLTGLRREHAWFRTDGRLRGRAVTEVLFHCTGLKTEVASRSAQDEWRLATAAGADPHIRAAATDRWRAAWQNWASAHH